MTNLPPGQQRAAAGKWPVVGERGPAAWDEPWSVTVSGLVAHSRSWTLAELHELDAVERVIDIHCVTRWSQPGIRFRGVPLARLLDVVQPQASAAYVSFIARSERNHSTSLPLADALQLQTLVAWQADGLPLPVEHGGPVRVVVPGRYFYKSLKWLAGIELLAEDRLGFWEREAGYHNTADPWREQRYMASNLDRQETARLLDARDVFGLELRGFSAAGRELRAFRAAGALLRDADFRRADLAAADFRGSNLSNAHFQQANLRDADFAEADLEGADFAGADLRGADFRGALLTAVSFTDARFGDARLDASTRLDASGIEQLTPAQQEFARRRMSPSGR